MSTSALFLQIANQTNNSEFVLHVSDIAIQAILASTTIALAYITWRSVKKTHKQTDAQLELTRKEIEHRIKPDLQIIVQESNLKKIDEKNYDGSVVVAIKNNGVISARNIRVSFRDPTSSLDLPQLIRDENTIKNSFLPILGSILPQSTVSLARHKTTITEYKEYQVALWVTYDYADVKNAEFIQIVIINAQVNSLGPLYEQAEIEETRKREHR